MNGIKTLTDGISIIQNGNASFNSITTSNININDWINDTMTPLQKTTLDIVYKTEIKKISSIERTYESAFFVSAKSCLIVKGQNF